MNPLPNPASQISDFLAEKVHHVFDMFFAHLQSKSLSDCLETASSTLFDCTSVLWIYNKEIEQIFSPQLDRISSDNSSIVSICIKDDKIFADRVPSLNPNFDFFIDSFEKPSLVFPLHQGDNSVYGAVQCIRDQQFTNEETNVCKFFDFKFKNSCHLFLSPLSDFSNKILSTSSSLPDLLENLKLTFNCQDFTILYLKEQNIYIYNQNSNEFVQTFDYPPLSKANSEVIIQSNLFIPIRVHFRKYFIRITGKSSFSHLYRSQLDQICPLLVAGIESRLHKSNNLINRLKPLLQIAQSMSSVLDVDSIIQIINENAKILLHAERCILFIINKKTHQLTSKFQEGLSQQIQLPIEYGLVGKTASTGEIINLKNAYEDPRFDSSIDQVAGFRNKNIFNSSNL